MQKRSVSTLCSKLGTTVAVNLGGGSVAGASITSEFLFVTVSVAPGRPFGQLFLGVMRPVGIRIECLVRDMF